MRVVKSTISDLWNHSSLTFTSNLHSSGLPISILSPVDSMNPSTRMPKVNNRLPHPIESTYQTYSIISTNDIADIDQIKTVNTGNSGNRNQFDDMVGRTISDGTKKQYLSKMNEITKFLKVQHPNLLDESGDLKILDVSGKAIDISDAIYDFFGSRNRLDNLIQNPNGSSSISAANSKAVNGIQTLQGFKSALKNYYATHSVPFCQKLDAQIEKFLSGYKRVFAEKKQRGQVRSKEGKDALSVSAYTLLAQKLLTLRPGEKSKASVTSSGVSSLYSSSISACMATPQSTVSIPTRIESDAASTTSRAFNFLGSWIPSLSSSSTPSPTSVSSGSMLTNCSSVASLSSLQELTMPVSTIKASLVQSWDVGIFAHCYLVLQYCLMGRSNEVSKITLSHIFLGGDGLKIVKSQDKTHQEGDDSMIKNISGNPLKPEVCPILAMALLVFSKEFTKDLRLFQGESQDHRFGDTLGNLLKSLSPDELLTIGSNPKDLGTHSIRKGACECACDTIDGPTIFSILMRGGWSVGTVLKLYLRKADGMDIFLSRILAQLPFHSTEFAALPANFQPNVLSQLNFTSWNQVHESYDNFPRNFQQCIPLLFAAIVDKSDWIRSVLPTGHPFFNSSIMIKGLIHKFKPYLSSGKFFHDPNTGMKALGIPRSILLMQKLDESTQKNAEGFKQVIDYMQELPTKVYDNIHNQLDFNGKVALSKDDLVSSIQEMIMPHLRKLGNPSSYSGHSTANSNRFAIIDANEKCQDFYWVSYDDTSFRQSKRHMVPRDFQMPTVTVRTAFSLWHFGHESFQYEGKPCRLQRYRSLLPMDISHKEPKVTATERVSLTRWNGVMKAINKILLEQKFFGEKIGTEPMLNLHQLDLLINLPDRDTIVSNIFEKAFSILLDSLQVKPFRPSDLKIDTVYGYIHAPKKKIAESNNATNAISSAVSNTKSRKKSVAAASLPIIDVSSSSAYPNIPSKRRSIVISPAVSHASPVSSPDSHRNKRSAVISISPISVVSGSVSLLSSSESSSSSAISGKKRRL